MTLEFLGQELALLLDGQREIRIRLDRAEATLPTLATKELVVQVWDPPDSKIHSSELGEQLLRARLVRRVADLERARS